MITEDYVSFKVAKLLKERGFDARCPMIYTVDGKLIYTSVKHHNMYAVTNKYLECYTDIIAPSQTMAMKWLREICGLFIRITEDITGNVFEWSVYQKNYGCKASTYVEDSYEEACEAAIKYCLEYLI